MVQINAHESWRKAGKAFLYIAAFFIFAAVVNHVQAPRSGNIPTVNSLELHTLTGEKISIATTCKKTVVYFFAPWCAVCKVSMDAIDMFAGKNNLQAIAVGLDYDNVAELKPYAEKRSVPVYAGNSEIQRRFLIDRYPTVYIIDKDGRIAHTMVGYTSRFGIWIRTLL